MKTLLFCLMLSIFSLPAPASESFVENDCLLEPNRQIDLASQIPGIIESIKVDRGDRVKKQQVLVQLMSGVEKAQVALASAKVSFGKRNVSRNEELYSEQMLSEHEKDELETDVRIAELELREARERLKMRTIRSPINGVVVDRHASEGELLSNEPVLTIASISPLYAEVILPASLFGKVSMQSTATIKPDQKDATAIEATVRVVDPVVDAGSSTFRVRLTVPNEKTRIPSGIGCTASFFISSKEKGSP